MFWQKIILKGITEIIVVKFIEKTKFKPNLCEPNDRTCHNKPWVSLIHHFDILLNKQGKNSQSWTIYKETKLLQKISLPISLLISQLLI